MNEASERTSAAAIDHSQTLPIMAATIPVLVQPVQLITRARDLVNAIEI